MNQLLVNPFEQYLELEKKIKHKPTTVTTTFSPRLNEQFDGNGIEPTTVVMLGAKYGVGKTYFALNWIMHLIKDQKKVIFFSLDMDFQKIVTKIVRYVMGIGKIDAINAMRDERETVREALRESGYFDYLKIYTNEKRPISFKEISSICTEEKPDVVFIDHFGKIYGIGHNPYQESKVVAEYLRNMKTKINTTFVVLIQMRKADSKSRGQNTIPPFKDDYKGAGEVGEDADVMLSLARPDLDNDCPPEKQRIIVGALRKNRLKDDAEIGHIFWKYDPISTRMTDIYPIRI